MLMIIDAQGLTSREVCSNLKEKLDSLPEGDVSLDVIIGTRKDAVHVKAFLAMSGLQTSLEEEQGHYLLKVHGWYCRC